MAYRIRRVDVPVLAPRARPLKVLHVSDLHLTPRQRRIQSWLPTLAELEPDLVINTGDNLAHLDAVAPTLRALGPLLDLPGAFVLGSNDYYAPRAEEPGPLPAPRRRPPHPRPELPWRALRDAFVARGWRDLTNATARIDVGSRPDRVSAASTTRTSHLDRYADVAGPLDPDADLTIGLTHSPEPRVLDAMAADGVGLVLAGHTHGGQLCVPGFGAW